MRAQGEQIAVRFFFPMQFVNACLEGIDRSHWVDLRSSRDPADSVEKVT
jgi:hypothetical protein